MATDSIMCIYTKLMIMIHDVDHYCRCMFFVIFLISFIVKAFIDSIMNDNDGNNSNTNNIF